MNELNSDLTAPYMKFRRRALELVGRCMVPVRHAWLRIATGLVAVVLVLLVVCAGYSEWLKATTTTNYCSLVPQDWPEHGFRYLQLYVDNERLSAPIFDGRYVINLGRDLGNPYHLRMTQGGSLNYANNLCPHVHLE